MFLFHPSPRASNQNLDYGPCNLRKTETEEVRRDAGRVIEAAVAQAMNVVFPSVTEV